MQQLSTFACTGIPPGFVRSWSAQMPHQLRTEVLQFEFPGMKERRTKQIFVAIVTECRRDVRQRAAITKGRRDFLFVADFGAEPKNRFGLQTANPIDRCVDLFWSPIGNGFLE